MNQIITHHGWGLDSSFWKLAKEDFLEKNWIWQDSERGYFSEELKNPNWLKSQSNQNISMAICHSLGSHLINPNVLLKASHIVLINSFSSFIPKNEERSQTIRSLKKMEKKFETFELKQMIKEFIRRSFLPNPVELKFQKSMETKLENINSEILFNDFHKLYEENRFFKFFPANCKVLIIKSSKDLIVKENSSNCFINLINKNQLEKPKLIEIDNQGHIITDINIFKLINDWLNK